MTLFDNCFMDFFPFDVAVTLVLSTAIALRL